MCCFLCRLTCHDNAVSKWELQNIAKSFACIAYVTYCYRCSSVFRRSVSLSMCECCYTLVSPAKTAESIKVLFGLWSRRSLRNTVLDGSPDYPTGGDTFGVHTWICLNIPGGRYSWKLYAREQKVAMRSYATIIVPTCYLIVSLILCVCVKRMCLYMYQDRPIRCE